MTDTLPAARPSEPDEPAFGSPAPVAGTGRAERTGGTETGRTYVLDTSVLLADPWSLQRFAEHEVVIPLIVLTAVSYTHLTLPTKA